VKCRRLLVLSSIVFLKNGTGYCKVLTKKLDSSILGFQSFEIFELWNKNMWICFKFYSFKIICMQGVQKIILSCALCMQPLFYNINVSS